MIYHTLLVVKANKVAPSQHTGETMKIKAGCQLRFYYTKESSEIEVRIISSEGKHIEWDGGKQLGMASFLQLNEDRKSMDYLTARSFAQFLALLLAKINNLDIEQILWINDPITYEFYTRE